MADPRQDAARLVEKHFADLEAATKTARAARSARYPQWTGLHERDLPKGEPGMLFRGLSAQRESAEGLGQISEGEFYTADPNLAETYSTSSTDSSVRGKRHTFPEDYKPRVKAVLHAPTDVLDLTGESPVPPWALDIIEKHDPGAKLKLKKALEGFENPQRLNPGYDPARQLRRKGSIAPPRFDTGAPIDLDKVDRAGELFKEAKKRGHSTVKFRDYGTIQSDPSRRVSYVPLGDVETVGIYDTSGGELYPDRGWGEKLPESAKQLDLPFDPNVDPNISTKLKRFLKKLPGIGTVVGGAFLTSEVQAAYDRGGEEEAAKTLAIELARMGDVFSLEMLYDLAMAVPAVVSTIARIDGAEAMRKGLERPAREQLERGEKIMPYDKMSTGARY